MRNEPFTNGTGTGGPCCRGLGELAGHLWLYPMSGNAVLRKPTKIGNGWKGYTILGPGDFSGDGQADILARDSAGRLWLYPGDKSSGFGAPRVITSGWQGDLHRLTCLPARGQHATATTWVHSRQGWVDRQKELSAALYRPPRIVRSRLVPADAHATEDRGHAASVRPG
jgi:hypothetical protein